MPRREKVKPKTYLAKRKMGLAATKIFFSPYYTTDLKEEQEFIEDTILFEKGKITIVENEDQKKTTDTLKERSLHSDASALDELSRADLVALAKRLDVKANGKSRDIISRIVEASEHQATGSSAR